MSGAAGRGEVFVQDADGRWHRVGARAGRDEGPPGPLGADELDVQRLSGEQPADGRRPGELSPEALHRLLRAAEPHLYRPGARRTSTQ